MKKTLAFIFLVTGLQSLALDNRTEALHYEISAQPKESVNASKDTHPMLYALVEKLVNKAGIEMPDYISLFSALSSMHMRSGEFVRVIQDMNPTVGLLGDLYLCRELLLAMTYEEIQGMVAIAIAEKATRKHIKVAVGVTGTFVAYMAVLYLVSKKYNLKLKEIIVHHLRNTHCQRNQEDTIKTVSVVLIFPSLISCKAISDNLQKSVDLHAAFLTSYTSVINSIRALDRIRKQYEQENFFSRVACKLNIKNIWNTLTYPIRSYTSAERIAYLQKEAHA